MRADRWLQEDYDDEFWLIISLYGPWAIRTTPAALRRKPRKPPGEGDKRWRRG